MSMVTVSAKQVPDIKRSQRALEQCFSKVHPSEYAQYWHFMARYPLSSQARPRAQHRVRARSFLVALKSAMIWGFGLAHLFMPEEVKTIADALQNFPLRTFTSRYDPKQNAG